MISIFYSLQTLSPSTIKKHKKIFPILIKSRKYILDKRRSNLIFPPFKHSKSLRINFSANTYTTLRPSQTVARKTEERDKEKSGERKPKKPAEEKQRTRVETATLGEGLKKLQSRRLP